VRKVWTTWIGLVALGALLLPARAPGYPPIPYWQRYQSYDSPARFESQTYFENRGIGFPDGSWLRYDKATGNLIIHNTAENLQRIETLLTSPPPERPTYHVDISFLLLDMPAETARAFAFVAPGEGAGSDTKQIHELVSQWADRRRERMPDAPCGQIRGVFRGDDATQLAGAVRQLPGIRRLGLAQHLALGGDPGGGVSSITTTPPGGDAEEPSAGMIMWAAADVSDSEDITLEFTVQWRAPLPTPPGIAVCAASWQTGVEGRYDCPPDALIVLTCPTPVLDADGAPSPLQTDMHTARWEGRQLVAFLSVQLILPRDSVGVQDDDPKEGVEP
jgi:hypothetical protein